MYAPAATTRSRARQATWTNSSTAIRAAAIGLTDEQARIRPCRSALSIGGLIEHATYGMRGATTRLTERPRDPADVDVAAFEAHESSFVARPTTRSAVDALAAFDGRVAYLAAVVATDPGAPTAEPPAPWHGIYDARVRERPPLPAAPDRGDGSPRWPRRHHPEQIDGVAVPAIVLSEAGAPANDFFQPYVPAAGTIGAR